MYRKYSTTSMVFDRIFRSYEMAKVATIDYLKSLKGEYADDAVNKGTWLSARHTKKYYKTA